MSQSAAYTYPVYIDYGDGGLMRVEIYDGSWLSGVRRISKRKFLHDVMLETGRQPTRLARAFMQLGNPHISVYPLAASERQSWDFK